MSWQVASLIVRCRTNDSAGLATVLAQLPGTTIAGASLDTLIVLVEGNTERELADRFDAIRAHPNALSAVLVEHRIDHETTAESMSETES